MNERRTPGEPGQNLDPSSTTAETAESLGAEMLEFLHLSADRARRLNELLGRVSGPVEPRSEVTPLPRTVPTDEPAPRAASVALGTDGRAPRSEIFVFPPLPRTVPTDEPVPGAASLALCTDGRVLLSVEHLQHLDLAGMETWTGVVLRAPDVAFFSERVHLAAEELAGMLGGRVATSARTETLSDEDSTTK